MDWKAPWTPYFNDQLMVSSAAIGSPLRHMEPYISSDLEKGSAVILEKIDEFKYWYSKLT